MMLEFVHLTGAEAGKDLQTRRKVRSQAMRDFRRRQRAEREAASNKAGSANPTKPPARSRRSSAQQRDRSTSTGTFQTFDRNSIPPSEPSPPSMALNFNRTPDFESALPAVQTPGIALYGDYSSDKTPPQDLYYGPQMLHPSASPGMSYWNADVPIDQDHQTSCFVPRSPSAWTTDTDDAFQSPAYLNQMFMFCKSYLHWLRPGTDPEHAGKVLAEAWDTSHSATLSAACCLASVGHLDAVQPGRPGGNYALYKARVLRGVTENMQSSDLATSDETIGCLAMLTSYEMSRCSGEAATHLRGLKSILNMKGDAGAAPYGGAAEIETLDLLHAVIFNSPLIVTATEDLSTSNLGSADHALPELFARLLPLLVAEQEDFRSIASHLDQARLQGVPELLNSTADAVRTTLSDAGCLNESSLASFRSALEQFHLTNCGNEHDTGSAPSLASALYLTMTIFHDIILLRSTGPTAASSSSQTSTHVAELLRAVRQVKDPTWTHMPYLRLFILLRGAVSAQDATRTSFFKAQLVRAIYQMGLSERKRVKHFMVNYLNMINALERPFQQHRSSPSSISSSKNSDFNRRQHDYLDPGWPRHSISLAFSGLGDPSLSRAATVDNGSLYHQPSYFGSGRNTPNSFSVSTTPYQDVDTDPFSHLTHNASGGA